SSFYAFTTAYDEYENVYAGGIGYGLGWPVDTGSFQQSFKGYVDVVINKYNNVGSLKIFSTYYGGKYLDIPLSISVNNNGEIAIGGFSSSHNLPMLNNSYDSTNN